MYGQGVMAGSLTCAWCSRWPARCRRAGARRRRGCPCPTASETAAPQSLGGGHTTASRHRRASAAALAAVSRGGCGWVLTSGGGVEHDGPQHALVAREVHHPRHRPHAVERLMISSHHRGRRQKCQLTTSCATGRQADSRGLGAGSGPDLQLCECWRLDVVGAAVLGQHHGPAEALALRHEELVHLQGRSRGTDGGRAVR